MDTVTDHIGFLVSVVCCLFYHISMNLLTNLSCGQTSHPQRRYRNCVEHIVCIIPTFTNTIRDGFHSYDEKCTWDFRAYRDKLKRLWMSAQGTDS